MYHDLWSSSFIFPDFPQKIMKYQQVIKCYKHHWENRWSPDISPSPRHRRPQHGRLHGRLTGPERRAGLGGSAAGLAALRSVQGRLFGNATGAGGCRSPGVEHVENIGILLRLNKWHPWRNGCFFFLTFMFFLNVLMIFGTFDPIALWNTSRCSSTLLQPFLHWLLCSKAQWIYLADMATLCGLGSCGVWAWCARLDTQTLRQEIRRPPAPPPCPGFIDTNQEPEEFHITAMSGAKNSDGFQQDHAVFARKEAS